MLFCDAGFAGDLKDSKSTSGGLLCIVGPNTFAPITWMCKKQIAVSHSSTEAEIVALDAALRTEGLPAIQLWDLVLEVLDPPKESIEPTIVTNMNTAMNAYQLISRLEEIVENTIDPSLLPPYFRILLDIDYVPANYFPPPQRAQLILLEDNDTSNRNPS